MINMATVVSMPEANNEWATVRDAYGNNNAVNIEDLPAKAKDGMTYAYRVEIQSRNGNTTLKPLWAK